MQPWRLVAGRLTIFITPCFMVDWFVFFNFRLPFSALASTMTLQDSFTFTEFSINQEQYTKVLYSLSLYLYKQKSLFAFSVRSGT